MHKSRRWPVYLAAGLFCIFLFLIATLPAYWVDWLLNRTVPDRVRIQETTGSVWNGAGNLIVRSLGQEVLQTRVDWSVQPLWLLAGKLQLRVSGRDNAAPLQATVRVGYRYLSIHAVDATLPAGVAAVFHPAVTLVAPTGRLYLATEQAALTPAGLEGAVQLTWLGAGMRMSGLSELGDYRLIVTGRGSTAELRIDTLRGDVGVTAQGTWQAQGEGLVQLAGSIAPGSREQALRPLLTTMNIQNSNGRYNWTLNNRFSLARLFGATP